MLLLAAVLFAMMAIRRVLRSAPAATARQFRRILLWGGLFIALVFAATGRLGVLVPLIGAMIAAMLRLLPVLVPMLLQYLPLWKRWQQQRAGRPHSGGGADATTVNTKYLRMQLNHSTGEIAGEVLAGRHAGRQLGELDRDQLGDLYAECVRNDRESATLLRAYLERVYGGDWEEGRNGRRQSAASGGTMTPDEAYEVLGLERGASRDDVIGAHRRLMQRLHPDRGGSDYLAAKINQAKDILLGH